MLVLRKEAEEDIRSARKWYENQRENLGRAFIVEIDRMLAAIEEHPDAYLECFSNVRRALCKKFPYAIYFVRENSDIVILAVLHQRRHSALSRRRVRR
jgi:plasmid stabilization system protein ParE